jgi:KipI family sensor histidine kinase inhibitor
MEPGPVDRPTLEALGDRALLVQFGDRIDARLNQEVHALAARIRGAALPGLVDLVPAYASLALHYEPAAWALDEGSAFDALCAALEPLLAGGVSLAPVASRRVEIPVRYGGECGEDLAEVAALTGLDPREVVARHAGGTYRVFMLGFTPGFAYLGGMDPVLAVPRRASPRVRVPAGSVGIAGIQTGIYPCDSPGGWRLIGRTALTLFNPEALEPCLLQPGDEVRFVAEEILLP